VIETRSSPRSTRFASLLDTHAHLCDRSFDDDLADVLTRARTAGVSTVVAVSETIDDARRNLELARSHAMILAAAGLFPTRVDERLAEEMIAFVRRHRKELVAIGEVGLDRWAVKEPELLVRQREIFASFVDLSVELDLPLNVHSRSAGRRAIDLMLERGATRVQLHAFDGRASTALPAVEAGYYFSIPPSIVRSRQKQKLVARLPLDALLVETDSPVLGRDPAARNEPCEVVTSILAIAEIKVIDAMEVAERTTANARALYGAIPD